jgi:hypothetical protein
VEARQCEAAGVDQILIRPLDFAQIWGLFHADDETHAAAQGTSCTRS